MQMALQKIGLNKKEIAVYLAALRFGVQPVSVLAKKAELNRVTTYSILDSLAEKGLLSQTIKAGIRCFAPLPPRELPAFLDRQKEKIERSKSDIVGIIGKLEAIQNPAAFQRPRLKFFEGKEGIRELLDDTLTGQNPEICGILSLGDLYEIFGEKYFADYVTRRIKKGFSMRIIRSKSADIVPLRWPDNKEARRERRYAPPDFLTPMTTYLYDDHKVAFFSSEAEGYGLLIESKDFFTTQKYLFENLWRVSTPTQKKQN